MDLVSIVGAKWARYASIESKEGCSQSSRSVMWGELADALPGVSTGCQLNLNARLPHVSVTRTTRSQRAERRS